MLCLNGAAIHQAVSRIEVLDKVEETMKFQEDGQFLMPVRTHLDFQGNTLLLMPCFTDRFYGTKLVSLHPDNPSKNKPMLHAVVVLNDGETGEPLALLDGRVLTALRTRRGRWGGRALAFARGTTRPGDYRARASRDSIRPCLPLRLPGSTASGFTTGTGINFRTL